MNDLDKQLDAKVAPETAKPAKPTREMKKAFDRAADRRASNINAEVEAVKQVAQQINATAQMAVALAGKVFSREMELSQIVLGDKAALCVVRTRPGLELRDEVLEDISTITKLPVLVIPKDMALESVSVEQMEAAGWTRLGPRGVVKPGLLLDAAGNTIPPGSTDG